MSTDFVSLIQYLDASELEILKAQLQRSKINCLVNEHGPNTGNRQNLYFEIKVSPKHYSQAKKIVQEFKSSQSNKNKKCPNCKSSAWEPLSKPSILQRILYIGTTPVRCKKCKTVYAI